MNGGLNYGQISWLFKWWSELWTYLVGNLYGGGLNYGPFGD